jgi:hypothetical protein
MTSSTSAHSGGGTRRLVALGLVLGLGLTGAACGGDDGDAGSPKPAAVRRGPVSVDFESGALPGGTEAHQAEIVAGAARNGGRGLEIRATGGEAYVSWDSARLGGDGPYWSFRAWMRIVDWTDGESVDLFTVRNGEVLNNFDLFVGSPNREIQWDLYRGDAGQTAAPLVPGQWYLVEARGSFAGSTYRAEVRIDGVDQTGIVSPDQVPSAVREFVLGSIGTAKTNTVQFDDISVALGAGPLPFLGPPGDPTTGSTRAGTGTVAP